MRHTTLLGTIGVFAIALTIGLAAQTPKPAAPKASGTDKAADERAIIAAEQKVIEAVAAGDAVAFKALVKDDGFAIDGNGPMANSEFMKNIKLAKIEPGWKISDPKVIWAASNTAVLYYKWTGKSSFMGQAAPPVVFSSTVWHKNGNKWVAVFHQESAAAPGK